MTMQIPPHHTIQLPEPDCTGTIPLETAIARRRSVRAFRPEALSLTQIGQLLWAAQGITGLKTHKRTAPSAGGCCPLIFYACWQQGVWQYEPEQHILRLHLEQDIRSHFPPLAWNQEFLASAGLVIAISAIYQRTTEKYGERGRLHYVPMDIGHAAQNVLLQAVALGLGGVPVGAFSDEPVKQLLQLPEEEALMYLLPVGYPA